VIHKIIRSSHEDYFWTVLIAYSNKEYEKIGKLLDKKENTQSKKRQSRIEKKIEALKHRIKQREVNLLVKQDNKHISPLELALDRKNVAMVRNILSRGTPPKKGNESLLKRSFGYDDSNYLMYIELLKAMYIYKRDNGSSYEDTEFREYIKSLSPNSYEEKLRIEKFDDKHGEYVKYYESTKSEDPSGLDDSNFNTAYEDKKNKFIELVKTKNMTADVRKKIDESLKLNPTFAVLKEKYSGKTVIELVIERNNKDADLFRIFYDTMKKTNRFDPMGECGDLLTLAIIYKNMPVIKYLMNEYNNNPKISNNIMGKVASYNRDGGIDKNNSGELLNNPLHIFLANNYDDKPDSAIDTFNFLLGKC
jgi:uncharacterized protein YbgA (DUF1722 family)